MAKSKVSGMKLEPSNKKSGKTPVLAAVAGGCTGSVRETVEYLAKRQATGWIGSVSIHNRYIGQKGKKQSSEVEETAD